MTSDELAPLSCHSSLITRHFLNVRFRFRQAEHLAALFPLPALFEQFNALETLQDIAFGRDRAGAFQAAMLRHDLVNC